MPGEMKRKRNLVSSPDQRDDAHEESGSKARKLTGPAVPQIVVDRPESSVGSDEATSEGLSFPANRQGFDDSLHSFPSSRESLDSESSVSRPGSPGPAFIPSRITYSLHTTFEDSEPYIHGDELTASLNDAESYCVIETIAQRYAQKVYGNSLGQKDLSFRYGNCTLLGEKGFKCRRPLRSLEDWGAICKVIAGYWTANSSRTLSLEILREYASYQSRATNEATLTEAKRMDIHDLMKRYSHKSLGRPYIPHTDLEKVIPKNMVPEIINEDQCKGMDPSNKAAFIEDVQSRGRKLLVMFVHNELHMECLKKLLDSGYDDTSLPLTSEALCHKRCGPKFDAFIDRQGAYLAARFNKVGEHQDFDHHVVIPIHFCPKDVKPTDLASDMDTRSDGGNRNAYGRQATAKDRALCGSGAYSSVFRVRLHPNHHALSLDKDAYFALKEFRHRPHANNSDFSKELRILNVLRRFNHDHIVTHLATWVQDEVYCMLFPYAQCNLREYMMWNEFQFRGGRELWLLEQLKGLASALKLIHDLSNEDTLTPLQSPRHQAPSPILTGERRAGWHHDLKPENILYFWDTDPPLGTFRISDWGSGRVNTYRSGRTVFTPSPNGTLTYEPPEVLYEGKTSRPYDVWSLGCVFLELLVWAVWNFRAVKAFGNERIDRRDLWSASTLKDDAFWQRLEGGNVVLRQSVKNWISKLEDALRQPKQAPLMAAFELVRDMLDPRRNVRIPARDVEETLGRICVQALVGLEDDDSADADNDPLELRLSLKAPDRRYSDSASHANSLSSRHVAPAFGDQVFASPIDMMSPHMRHSELSPSTASRSRQNSLASSVISVRDGRSGPSKANTPEPMEERK
ncbi:hypothetical protein N7G274_001098 [Stereocaulon virgatum]|uniref:Protein kinase domain-containing protein n=1 Tax=Stereocaulon virgatum TaxID=373712 RepID=A0ABR4ANF1_9LECA